MKTKLTLLLLALASFIATIAPAQTVGGIKNLTDNKAGISYNANAITVLANYTVTAKDHTILVNASGGAVTVTLPAVGDHRFPYLVVSKIDSTANTVTIDGAGANTINGKTTLVLRNQYAVAILHADGVQWHWLNAPGGTTGTQVLTAATTINFTPDATTKLFTLTPNSNVTFTGVLTGAVINSTYHLEITTSGTSSYTMTFGTNFKSTGTLATGATSGKKFLLSFLYDGTQFIEQSRTAAQ